MSLKLKQISTRHTRRIHNTSPGHCIASGMCIIKATWGATSFMLSENLIYFVCAYLLALAHQALISQFNEDGKVVK